MTRSIVAPAPPNVDARRPLSLVPGNAGRPLSLAHDVPLPVEPPAPSAQALAALTAHPHAHGQPTVPAGATAGPDDVEQVLGEIVAPVEDLRRRIGAARPAGFMVTAADVQRHREVAWRLDEIARILAERA